ncbi:MAG: hypothetical protein K1X92_13590 [Bacteroidia bacterium]|nr:hypothetical protein [Bacteroidia bacterium]
MKKSLYFVAFVTILVFRVLTGCQSSEDKQRELDLKERELALKEKELSLNQNPVSTTSKPSNQGIITGNGVIMRSGNSVESAKLGNFTNGEKVEILEETKPKNENQAIAAKPVKLYSDYNGKYIATLNKGKALVIEEYTGSEYKVSFQHPEYGKLYATVSPSELESISNEVWYKVKRASGEEGWVIGKFVKK